MNPNLLSVEEFDRLISFLMSDRTPAGCLDFEGIEGLFAAAICSPVLVSPLEAINEAFGGEIIWKSEAEMADVYSLLLRHWNYLAEGFESGEWDVHIAEEGIPPGELGMAWANGFVMGMEFHFDAWQALIEDEKHSVAILPITVLSGIFDEESGNTEPIVGEEREQILSLLGSSTIEIFDYWRNARKNAALAAHAAQRDPSYEKIARNAPCPCGSGKKFKQCCGKSSR